MPLFEKLFRERFFNKILIAYTAIIVVTFATLSFAIYKTIVSSIRNEAVNYNMQVVQDIKSYFTIKIDKVTQILQQPYYFHADYIDFFDYLSNNNSSRSYEFNMKKAAVDRYLEYACHLDGDIMDVLLLKIKDWSDYYYTIRPLSIAGVYSPDTAALSNSIKPDKYGIVIIPAFYIFNDEKQNYGNDVYSYAAILRQYNSMGNLAILLVNFSTSGISESYEKENGRFKSTVMVFTKKGDVIYDSEGKYYDAGYPRFGSITDASGARTANGDIVNTYVNDKQGFIVASIIPGSQIRRTAAGTRNTILAISALCILVAIALSSTIMSVFSRKVKAVNSAMKKVREGDLSTRAAVGRRNDEINEIAVNFNLMCDNLNEYIDKVYVFDLQQKDAEVRQKTAELRQKAAELYALQSQINPHSLYNTLEAIRMRAVTAGVTDIADMIRILASVFRNSIKKDMIVRIKDELAYCRNYLELYNIRYGPNLEVFFDVDEGIMEYGIVKHLLQPLIENSLIHGIDVNKPGNRIIVKGAIDNGTIAISITDNGKGMNEEALNALRENMANPSWEESNSIGINNVNQRIRIIYGNEYRIEINSEINTGTTVTVRIPAKTVKELAAHVQGNAG